MSLPPLIPVEELFADPVFSNPSVSPDGKRLGYLAPNYGRTNVWIRGLDEEHADAVCVTHDARRGIKTYYWTDDPQWLLYLQDTDGNEQWHLYRVDLDAPDQPAVDLTPMDEGSRVMSVEPIGSMPGWVMVGMNKRPLNIDAFRIEIATGEVVVHRENPDPTGGFFFGHNAEVFRMGNSPEGAWEFSEVDATTGDTRLICSFGGPEFPVGVSPVKVSPDGKALYVGAYADGGDDLSLVRVDVTTGEQTVVAGMPGRNVCVASLVSSALPPSLYTSKKTKEVIAVRFTGDRPTIMVIDPAYEEIFAKLAALSEGVLATLSSDADERFWVATFTHDTDPDLAWLYDHETGETRLLFRPYPDLAPETLAPMTAVRLNARDGLPLHAFLTLPVGVEPAGLPLVLAVHGGPWYHDAWTFNKIAQFFANRGYAVLQVNFRGSTGYGKNHIISAVHELAGTMHNDLIDAANWAVEQGYADPTRIGIYGGSYGGYSALVGVTVTPDYFAAAVDYVGISDLSNFMRTLPEFIKPMMTNSWYCYVGDPDKPEELADMMARSPITMVDKIVTPLLVVQGANDARVVQAEADNIVAALTERGVPVEYILAADEGHGFQNPENLNMMFRAVEKHFAEHLGGRGATA